MFQSFFTGYFSEGVKVMDPRTACDSADSPNKLWPPRRMIVKHYLKSWFILDLVVVGCAGKFWGPRAWS